MMQTQYAMMEEDGPPLRHRSYSARTPDQCDPPSYHDCYLQFQPDGSTRTIFLSSGAASFDEGILAADANFQRRCELSPRAPRKQRRCELSPRAPRKHRSPHPHRQFYQLSTAPRHPLLKRRTSELPLRRPSLSSTSPDPRSFSSSRDVMTTPKKSSSMRVRRKKADKSFQPQRSNNIYRRFEKVAPKQQDDDDDEVWVERLILNGPEGVKKTCFKSLRGNVTRNEPPTGANTIVYLEDIIVDRDGRPSMTKAKSKSKSKSKSRKQEEKKRKKQKEPKKEQASSSQPQKDEESLASKSQKDEQETETTPESKNKLKRQLKRRSSFLELLKKNRKNKNKNGDAPENE